MCNRPYTGASKKDLKLSSNLFTRKPTCKRYITYLIYDIKINGYSKIGVNSKATFIYKTYFTIVREKNISKYEIQPVILVEPRNVEVQEMIKIP